MPVPKFHNKAGAYHTSCSSLPILLFWLFLIFLLERIFAGEYKLKRNFFKKLKPPWRHDFYDLTNRFGKNKKKKNKKEQLQN